MSLIHKVEVDHHRTGACQQFHFWQLCAVEQSYQLHDKRMLNEICLQLKTLSFET